MKKTLLAILGVLCAATIGLSVLSACGGGGDPKDDPTTETPSDPTNPSDPSDPENPEDPGTDTPEPVYEEVLADSGATFSSDNM